MYFSALRLGRGGYDLENHGVAFLNSTYLQINYLCFHECGQLLGTPLSRNHWELF